MKLRSKVVSVLVLLVVLTLTMVLGAPAVAAAPPAKASVSGGGTVAWDGGFATYGFTAMQLDAAGAARGKAHVIVRDASPVVGMIEIDITNLAVDYESGDAWLGGVITNADPEIWVGVEVIWRVHDGGRGGADATSSIYAGKPAAEALTMPDLPLVMAWTNGNVTLR